MNNILAALIFFTRLPWWRLREVPKEAFEHVVDWWSFVGWLTGGVMALVFWGTTAAGLPIAVSAILAVMGRMLLTGALHEDGLADFCDGFGGGTSRERTLEIMKDSHIGTNGVLGLMVVLSLLAISISNVGAEAAVLLLFFDVLAKSAASLVTGQLPYARSTEGAKNKVVYVTPDMGERIVHLFRVIAALLPAWALCAWQGVPNVVWIVPVPFVVEWLLTRWMRNRIGGYTGDCCGALFVLCEISAYLAYTIINK